MRILMKGDAKMSGDYVTRLKNVVKIQVYTL